MDKLSDERIDLIANSRRAGHDEVSMATEIKEHRSREGGENAEVKRLRAALRLIQKNEGAKHLGRPRSSDMNCSFCVAYLADNYGAFGEYLETEDFKKPLPPPPEKEMK